MQGSQKPQRRKNVLVTGANGFIGNAVARAFVSAGYRTFGLVRKEATIHSLARDEITPVVGTPDKPDFLTALQKLSRTFDVIVSTTEDFDNYSEHFAAVRSMLVQIGSESSKNGVRPLAIFTSGCKDYGIGPLDSAEVKPYTEDSPLNPPPILLPRTMLSQKVFEDTDFFDAVVTRPTTLYGGSSSYYGAALDLAAKVAKSPGKRLKIAAKPNSIMHGTHVADVAAAYVQLAEADRAVVSGKVYNISSWRYETAQEVADALVQEYGLDGVDFVGSDGSLDEEAQKQGFDVVGLLFGFSQWIGSDLIRGDTEWRDRQPLFSEALHVYRRAYEAAALEEHSNIARIQRMVSTWNA